MNTVILTARLTKNPELRFTASQKAVCTLGVAENNPYNKDNTVFINVIAWGKMGENCANYLEKGRLIGIKGRLQTRSYEAQDGTKRYITEIVAEQVEFLENKNKGQASSPGKQQENDPGEIDLNDFMELEEDGLPF